MSGSDPTPDPDAWLTVKEIAEELRLTPATIRSWISTGTLNARRAGQRKWLVQRSELDRMLAGQDRPDPDRPEAPGWRPPDTILAPHQSLHWTPEALEYVRRPSWLRFIDTRWRDSLARSRFVPPDPWFVQRVRDIAEESARKAAALVNLEGDDPGDWWHEQDGLTDGALSYELSPQANRPGPAALWNEFDAAVAELDLAMKAHSFSRESGALARLSVLMHEIAEDLIPGGYPWPETTKKRRLGIRQPEPEALDDPADGA